MSRARRFWVSAACRAGPAARQLLRSQRGGAWTPACGLNGGERRSDSRVAVAPQQRGVGEAWVFPGHEQCDLSPRGVGGFSEGHVEFLGKPMGVL